MTIVVTVLASVIVLMLVVCAMSFVRRPESHTIDRICLHREEYDRLITDASMHAPTACPSEPLVVVDSDRRDRRVLADPLYPPLDRSAHPDDTFHIVGYLSNNDEEKDVGGGVWKLFARQKNSNEATFYIIPANTHYDVKIMLDSGIVVGRALRDLYNIPDVVFFTSPLLKSTAYAFVRLPRTDFLSSRYV